MILHLYLTSEILKLMYDYSRLIFGFKKESSVKFTFNNFPKKRMVLVVLSASVVILLVLAVWIFVYKPSQQKTPTQKPSQSTQNPAKELPKTNPFEVKTNPFKDVKTNPFR